MEFDVSENLTSFAIGECGTDVISVFIFFFTGGVVYVDGILSCMFVIELCLQNTCFLKVAILFAETTLGNIGLFPLTAIWTLSYVPHFVATPYTQFLVKFTRWSCLGGFSVLGAILLRASGGI